MHELLKRRILEFLKQEKLSIPALEKKACLKTNVLRNIIYDSSKNPSLETLLKVSDVLGVSVDYLLRPESLEVKDQQDIILAKSVFNYVMNWLLTKKCDIKIETIFQICLETYKYSKETNNNVVDTKFANWKLENFRIPNNLQEK